MKQLWAGSAKKLIGDCKMYCVFVSLEDNPWTEEEKKKTLKESKEGLKWLEEQAEENDIELSFEMECLNEEEDVVIPENMDRLSDHSKKIEILQSIVEQLEYESITEFYLDMKEEDVSTHILFLFHVFDRSYMTSFAVEDVDQRMEVNIVFMQESIGRISSMVVAHETLHAYSAQDLYDVDGTDDGKAAMNRAAERFPNEIMMVYKNEVGECEMSEFTTFLLGWHNEPDDWYSEIAQPYNQQALQTFLDYHDQFDESGQLIVESEDEDVSFESDEGYDYVRYILNEDDGLAVWKKLDPKEEEDETQFDEDRQDDNYYYLKEKSTGISYTVPKKGGQGFIQEVNQNEWVPFCKMSPKG